MKKIEAAALAGLLVCVVLTALQLDFSKKCEAVREHTFRLHVVANSDSDADQQVKLAVRDAVLEKAGALLENVSDADGAAQTARGQLNEFSECASDVLENSGFDYGASARVTRMYFDERVYGEVTLPAGFYTALRVELGEARGRNWWCVIYPRVCMSASSDPEPAEGYEGFERELVLGKERFKLRFKTEEWLQSLLRESEENAV